MNCKNWLKNYLTNRQQYVQLKIITQTHQMWHTTGLDTGNLIYLNDIEDTCDSNILSFADDSAIYSSHSDNIINSQSKIGNKEINNLYTWFPKCW